MWCCKSFGWIYWQTTSKTKSMNRKPENHNKIEVINMIWTCGEDGRRKVCKTVTKLDNKVSLVRATKRRWARINKHWEIFKKDLEWIDLSCKEMVTILRGRKLWKSCTAKYNPMPMSLTSAQYQRSQKTLNNRDKDYILKGRRQGIKCNIRFIYSIDRNNYLSICLIH